jgi:hypothetical protein
MISLEGGNRGPGWVQRCGTLDLWGFKSPALPATSWCRVAERGLKRPRDPIQLGSSEAPGRHRPPRRVGCCWGGRQISAVPLSPAWGFPK